MAHGLFVQFIFKSYLLALFVCVCTFHLSIINPLIVCQYNSSFNHYISHCLFAHFILQSFITYLMVCLHILSYNHSLQISWFACTFHLTINHCISHCLFVHFNFQSFITYFMVCLYISAFNHSLHISWFVCTLHLSNITPLIVWLYFKFKTTICLMVLFYFFILNNTATPQGCMQNLAFLKQSPVQLSANIHTKKAKSIKMKPKKINKCN